ncbi:DUF2076 domain-containing protein [Rhizobium straminoryzae]|uniref:DUF2076 domain-containing protein n=1 Tax=Rhizobium straminoryzae TaxID=1387186 RepID=A0A549TDH9_9HYPH|nr:DUF2076 domain-containing protein [Rhizobium straminoryzae]TRL40095.1 DUF2076 domain-containing protein [Rhizobium straminoryzae]
MSPEERQLLNDLFQRIRSATATPRDGEAERLIADAVRNEPSAPYYLAQAVIVQEKGLEAASRRINELEARVRDLEAQAATPAEEQRGGFLSSIFGSGQPPRPAQRPAYNPIPSTAPSAGPWGSTQPAYGAPQAYAPPQQQPVAGPWAQQGIRAPSAGSSFLTGALGTAAGVAGGMLLANSLSGIFGNHMSGLGLGNPLGEGFGHGPIEETVINNYYGDAGQTTVADVGDNLQQAGYDDNTDWNADDTDDGSDDSDFV